MDIFKSTESEVRVYSRAFPVIFNRAKNAHLYTEDGSLYNTSASYSTAEAQLCKEAYGIMSTVYTQGSGFGDFTKVPACDPKDAVTGLDMHDAFHTS